MSLPDGITSRPLRQDDAALVAELLAEDELALRATAIAHGARRPLVVAADGSRSSDSWLLEEDGTAIAGGWFDRLDDHAFGGGCVRPGEKAGGSDRGSTETME